MSLRLVNRVAGALGRNSSVVMSRASNPKNIIQCRGMSKKKGDGTCKNDNCAADSQFFAGCFKKTKRELCPETKQKPSSTCKDTCKSGPCRPGKHDDNGGDAGHAQQVAKFELDEVDNSNVDVDEIEDEEKQKDREKARRLGRRGSTTQIGRQET
ncbi:hypothetical protein ACLKA7_016224 [Drosophila subpalustris]